MPLTDHQGNTGERAVPDRKARQEAGWTAEASGNEQDVFGHIMDEIGRLPPRVTATADPEPPPSA